MRLRTSTQEIGESQVEVTPKTKKSKTKATSAKRPQKVATPAPQEQTPVSNKKSKKRKSGIVVKGEQTETDLAVLKESSPPSPQDRTPVSNKKSKKRKSGIVVKGEPTETDLAVSKESSPPKKQKKATDVKQATDQKETSTSAGEAKVEVKSPSPSKKKNNKKKQPAAETKPSPVQSSEGKRVAIEYLHLWKKSKAPGGSKWRFQKVRQVWLLHNMLDSTKISSDDFATLLEYLKALQGKSRQLTAEKMESLIQELDGEMQKTEEGAGDDKNSLKEMKTKWKRASSVLQTLT